jgi:two-component system OmpR family response regulator
VELMQRIGKQAMLENRFTEKLCYFLRYYEASQLACGMIFARCEKRDDPDWNRLQQKIRECDPDLAAQFFYDESSELLAILLDDCQLPDTHYHALPIKDLLKAEYGLKGSVCIASFPESGETMQVILQEIVNQLAAEPRHHDAIRIVVRQEPDSRRKPRLLLIESDPIVRQMLTVRFQRNGYDVETAENGKEGMDKYRQWRPDLVITELTLPIVNGHQLIDWLQNQQKSDTDCKIIVLTDKRLEEDMAKCFLRGVADYITKPFSPIELDLRVKRVLVS